MDISIKEQSWIARIAAKKLRVQNVAIVLGNHIHLHNVSREDFLNSHRWVKHEMCHVQQFRKYGFLPFIFRYLWESVLHGYQNNKYEVEARNAEDD